MPVFVFPTFLSPQLAESIFESSSSDALSFRESYELLSEPGSIS
jgi:hypothetical protein